MKFYTSVNEGKAACTLDGGGLFFHPHSPSMHQDPLSASAAFRVMAQATAVGLIPETVCV